jgi:hypothetical protein
VDWALDPIIIVFRGRGIKGQVGGWEECLRHDCLHNSYKTFWAKLVLSLSSLSPNYANCVGHHTVVRSPNHIYIYIPHIYIYIYIYMKNAKGFFS